MNAQFAIAPSNVIAHISEVDRGLGCGCTCPVCHEPVIAKKGPEREHHFAHASNQADCAANYETQLHQYAIRVIQETMGLIVPIDHEQGPGRWLAFDKVAEEERLDATALRPDIIGYANGAPTLIEIAYSSFVGDAKRSKLAQLNLPALEIDLHDYPPECFDPAAVKQAVCHGLERKQWLYEIKSGPASQPRRITIRGIFVYLRRLSSSGDLAIKVSVFNPEVNGINKQIAQQHRGRWHPPYKNWIVPYRFAEQAEYWVLRCQDLPTAS